MYERLDLVPGACAKKTGDLVHVGGAKHEHELAKKTYFGRVEGRGGGGGSVFATCC